ncbi:MAG: asparagine synthase (glutamine-hydrolyzing), partial [Methylococcales bacterium]
MSGIAGFINFKNTGKLQPDFLKRALDCIVHRGPDAEGQFFDPDGTVGLGMRRLSIIDLSTGSQPMCSDDGQIVIVFNGELYNYIEIKQQLNCKNYKTQSDTEVFLNLYVEKGIKGLDSTRGMFGAAIWDRSRKKLVLMRDRFGKKPLYYYFDDERLLFGSEIKSILEHPDVPRRLSSRALDHYLTWLAVPEPDTMFEGIYKLPPGHVLEVDLSGKRELIQYWRLAFPEYPLAANRFEATDLLVQNIEDAIRLRLRSDVPLGVLLSGGVDSSAIVAIASRHASGVLRTYSVGFNIHGYNEFQYSRAVAKRYATEHTEVVMPAHQYWNLLQEVVWNLDEPIADTATVPLMHICREASRSVKVLLSGAGSDEIMAGYANRYLNGYRQHSGLSSLGEQLPRRLRLALWRYSGNRSWPGSRRLLWQLTQPIEYQFLKNSVHGYYEGLREYLYYGGPFSGYEPDEADLLHRLHNNGRNLLDRMLFTDTTINLPAYLLMKADKIGMAASVELRCPFLDHIYAEFCASLPPRFKLDIGRGQGKILLKQALEPYLPYDVLYRPKMRFPVPIDDWLRDQLKSSVSDLLLSSHAKIAKMFCTAHINNMWQAHQQQRQTFGIQLW